MYSDELSSAADSCSEGSEAASSGEGCSSSEDGATTVSVDDFVSVSSEQVETVSGQTTDIHRDAFARNPRLQAISENVPCFTSMRKVQDVHLNLLLMGDNGLGKTTFIKEFLQDYKSAGFEISEGRDASSTKLEDFIQQPPDYCTEVEPILDRGVNVVIKMQDTPGWSGSIYVEKYIQAIVHFILQQEEKDYEQFQGSKGLPAEKMSGELKHTVTACVYFLAPHDIKPVDLILMSVISQLVSVIPIIAKADTMTQEEIKMYRQRIRAHCSDPRLIIACDIDVEGEISSADTEFRVQGYRFDKSSELRVSHEAPPFAVITRKPCGEQSDFFLLKQLLLGEEGQSLLRDAWKQFVKFCVQYVEAGKCVNTLVDEVLVTCRAYVRNRDIAIAEAALIKLQEEYDKLQPEQQHLLVQQEQLLEHQHQLQGQIKSAKGDYDQLHESHRQLQAKWQQSEHSLQKLQKEHKQRRGEHETLQIAHVHQTSENRKLQMQLQQLQQQHLELQEFNKSLRQECEVLTQKYQGLEDDNRGLQATQRKLQDQCDQLQAQQHQSETEWQQLYEYVHRYFQLRTTISIPGRCQRSTLSRNTSPSRKVSIGHKIYMPGGPAELLPDHMLREFACMIEGWRYYQGLLEGVLQLHNGVVPDQSEIPKPVARADFGHC